MNPEIFSHPLKIKQRTTSHTTANLSTKITLLVLTLSVFMILLPVIVLRAVIALALQRQLFIRYTSSNGAV